MAEVRDEPKRPKFGLSAPVPLTAEHELSHFDCGEPALNDWLRHRALKNESRFSRTYVVCEDSRVIAYFSISAGAVERAAAPGKLRRNAPDTIPVSVIGRLAVSRSHAGKGLGADILADALRRIAVASQSIGIGAVLVHAKDDAAKRFYMKCAEFIEYPQDSRTLFLPIETVVAAFRSGLSAIRQADRALDLAALRELSRILRDLSVLEDASLRAGPRGRGGGSVEHEQALAVEGRAVLVSRTRRE